MNKKGRTKRNVRIHELSECGVAMAVGGGTHPQVSGEMVRVPEGHLIVFRCAACGGRRERLLDYRKQITDSATLKHAAVFGEAERVFSSMARFRSDHVGCAQSPRSFTLAPDLLAYSDAQLDAARRAIESGSDPDAMVWLVLDDGRAAMLDVPFIPPSPGGTGTPKTMAYHEMLRGFREAIRSEALPVVGAVMTAVAWASADACMMPSCDPNRNEIVMRVVVAPDHGRLACHPITRTTGRHDGPGLVHNAEWLPLSSMFEAIDGLLANVAFTSVSRHSRRMGGFGPVPPAAA